LSIRAMLLGVTKFSVLTEGRKPEVLSTQPKQLYC
jgi:hypothetical protein